MLHKHKDIRPRKPEPSYIYANLLSPLSSFVHPVQLPHSPFAHTAAAVPSMVTDPAALGSS